MARNAHVPFDTLLVLPTVSWRQRLEAEATIKTSAIFVLDGSKAMERAHRVANDSTILVHHECTLHVGTSLNSWCLMPTFESLIAPMTCIAISLKFCCA